MKLVKFNVLLFIILFNNTVLNSQNEDSIKMELNAIECLIKSNGLFETDIENSKFLLKLANSLWCQNENVNRYTHSLIGLAGIYYYTGDYTQHKETIILIDEVFKSEEKLSDSTFIRMYNTKALYEMKCGRFHEGISLIEYILLNTTPSKYILSRLYENLASCYSALGDFTISESYYLKSHNVKKKIFGKNNVITADSYIALGNFYNLFNNYAKALMHLENAIETYDKIGIKRTNRRWYYGAQLLISDIYSKAKMTTASQERLNLIPKSIKDSLFYFESCLISARNHFSKGNLNESKKRLKQLNKFILSEGRIYEKEHEVYILMSMVANLQGLKEKQFQILKNACKKYSNDPKQIFILKLILNNVN